MRIILKIYPKLRLFIILYWNIPKMMWKMVVMMCDQRICMPCHNNKYSYIWIKCAYDMPLFVVRRANGTPNRVWLENYINICSICIIIYNIMRADNNQLRWACEAWGGIQRVSAGVSWLTEWLSAGDNVCVTSDNGTYFLARVIASSSVRLHNNLIN